MNFATWSLGGTIMVAFLKKNQYIFYDLITYVLKNIEMRIPNPFIWKGTNNYLFYNWF